MKKLSLLLIFTLLSFHFAFSQNEAGADKVICKGGTVTIGGPDKGYCYSWEPADGLSTNLNSSNPTVNPTATTTYKLTVVGPDFSFRRPDEVVVTVIENNPFIPNNVTVASGAAPKIPLVNRTNFWGYTDDENIEVEISACSDGKNWRAVVINIKGNYSEEVRLLPNVDEVTGPGGNTTKANFCNQVIDLERLTLKKGNWFIEAAVRAHEDIHASRLKPSLEDVANKIEMLFENLSVADNGQTLQDAILQIKALQAYKIALIQGVQLWDAAYIIRIRNDHQGGAGPAYIAEKGVVDPMITKICNHAKAQKWGLCASCPP